MKNKYEQWFVTFVFSTWRCWLQSYFSKPPGHLSGCRQTRCIQK